MRLDSVGVTAHLKFQYPFHKYSGTCLLWSPLGRNFLAIIDRWLLNEVEYYTL